MIWLAMTDKEPGDFQFDPAQEDNDRVLIVEDLFGESVEQ